MLNLPKVAIWQERCRQSSLHCTLAACTLYAFALLSQPAFSAQTRFVSPEAGVTALVEALRSDNQSALRTILGPYGSKLVGSGDPVADERYRDTFIQAYGEANKIVFDNIKHAELLIGNDGWPMPIPLIKLNDGKWRFDTRSGEVEILSRRIGRNELAAIQVCHVIVDAEREYTMLDADGDGLREYAAKFTSAPGKHDGLYWPTKPDEPLSPLGPLLASAARDGYASIDSSSLKPYHGYFYKLLPKQGKDAAGGAYNYFVNGKMLTGFAVLAYPARYGASGIMSFIVNQEGTIYERNLGKKTKVLAAGLTIFNPDTKWNRIQEKIDLNERRIFPE